MQESGPILISNWFYNTDRRGVTQPELLQRDRLCGSSGGQKAQKEHSFQLYTSIQRAVQSYKHRGRGKGGYDVQVRLAG